MDIINIYCNKYNQTIMSNIFKSNSRFSALLEDKKDFKKEKEKQIKNEIKPENKEKQLKSSQIKESRFKPYDEKEIEQFRLERAEKVKIQNELKEKEKERLHLENLSISNFPALISQVKKNDNKEEHLSYIDILKKKEEIKDVIGDPDLVNLQPGWVLIKKDPQTGNTITKYGIGTVFYEEPKKSEKELLLDAVDALIELHEKRTEEYIELNGYDIWEKMFKYPNWEEREAYLEEEEDIEDSSDENDEDNDNDNDDDYYDDYYDDY